MAQKGWSAKGLLRPLWNRYEGGRDALAAAVGTSGSVLSSINTGKRNLAWDLALRLAQALGVSVLELGAPADEPDGPGVLLLGRLEALEEALAAAAKENGRLARRLAHLDGRVRALERPGQSKTAPAARRHRKK